jgi:hypothetical protein
VCVCVQHVSTCFNSSFVYLPWGKSNIAT